MTGSHEVRGSTPLSSTTKVKHLEQGTRHRLVPCSLFAPTLDLASRVPTAACRCSMNSLLSPASTTVWTRPDGEALHAFTIITKDADEFMAHLHNRMLVTLDRDLEDAWLDTEITSARDILDLLEGSTGVTLDTYPVLRLVNRLSSDHELLIQPMK
jgi:putative SOS response-associated peptidase YedK